MKAVKLSRRVALSASCTVVVLPVATDFRYIGMHIFITIVAIAGYGGRMGGDLRAKATYIVSDPVSIAVYVRKIDGTASRVFLVRLPITIVVDVVAGLFYIGGVFIDTFDSQGIQSAAKGSIGTLVGVVPITGLV